MQQLLNKKSFQETIAYIDENYNFTPTTFKNGNQINYAGENNGSCKIFAFVKKHHLDKDQTLSLFGTYYFDDVRKYPDGNDHQNIRNFIKFGWEGINFENDAIQEKNI